MWAGRGDVSDRASNRLPRLLIHVGQKGPCVSVLTSPKCQTICLPGDRHFLWCCIYFPINFPPDLFPLFPGGIFSNVVLFSREMSTV